MLCSSSDDRIHGLGMAKQVKTGYILRYKKRLFGKDWREEYVVLYSDSTLCWFRDRTKSEPDGGLVIRDAPHMVAVGQWTSAIPYRPELPYGCTVASLLAFGTRKKEKVHWFLCKDADEVNSWMTAISNTLPPPPQPLRVQAAAQMVASAPPHSSDMTASRPTVTQAVPPPGPDSMFYPRRYPYGVSASGPMCHGPQHTTVLLRDSRSSDLGGFGTGLLTGAMLSNAATGWGMYGYGARSWGAGWGWGVGSGWGGVGGLERSALHYSDTDVHVNNYNDNDTTTFIHNDYHVQASDVTAAASFSASRMHHQPEVGSNGGGGGGGEGGYSDTSTAAYTDDCDYDFGGDFGGDGYDAGGGFDFIF